MWVKLVSVLSLSWKYLKAGSDFRQGAWVIEKPLQSNTWHLSRENSKTSTKSQHGATPANQLLTTWLPLDSQASCTTAWLQCEYSSGQAEAAWPLRFRLRNLA